MAYGTFKGALLVLHLLHVDLILYCVYLWRVLLVYCQRWSSVKYIYDLALDKQNKFRKKNYSGHSDIE
mgnify:CR=1 FL=1